MFLDHILLHNKQQGCFSKLEIETGVAGKPDGVIWPGANEFHVGSGLSEGLGHFQ